MCVIVCVCVQDRVDQRDDARSALVQRHHLHPSLVDGLGSSPGVRLYVCTHIYTFVRAYVHKYVRLYVHSTVRTQLRMYVRVNVRIYVRTYTRAQVPTHVRAGLVGELGSTRRQCTLVRMHI